MPKNFQFELQQRVVIAISGEIATVVGRAQYVSMQDQYQIRYVNAAGCAVEQWWSEDTLQPHGAEGC